MISKMMLFLLYLLVWSFLSWPADVRDFTVGIPVALFVTFMTVDLPVKRPRSVKGLMCCIWFAYYVAIFVWECVKANIDVAYRVVHPALPIRPGTVRIKTDLKSDIGLTLLANSITLTPGMTTVDVDRDRGFLYVHRLYVKDKDIGADSKPVVVKRFENILKRIFE